LNLYFCKEFLLPLLSVLLGAFGLRVSFFSLILFHSFTSFFIFALVSYICFHWDAPGTDALGRSSLVIETADVADPVSEPTTIFGSVIALGVGGWLKRKKSNQRNKTTQQH
jgi:hypothetical protein